MSDPETFDVGIVVFMRVPGVDMVDAGHRATAAVRKAIRTSATGGGGLLDEGRNSVGVMPVADVMEVGMAGRNGYLWTRATKLAAHDHGLDSDDV